MSQLLAYLYWFINIWYSFFLGASKEKDVFQIIDTRMFTITGQIVCQNLHYSKFAGRQNTDFARVDSFRL